MNKISEQGVIQVNSNWQQIAKLSCAKARALLTFEQALKLQVLPIKVFCPVGEDRVLIILTSQQNSEQLKQQLKFITQLEIVLEQCREEELAFAIPAAYLGNELDIKNLIEAIEGGQKRTDTSISILVEHILQSAVAKAATDIHLNIHEEFCELTHRVLGKVSTSICINKAISQAIVRRIKVLGKLDLTKQKQPQDGAFEFNYGATKIRARISSLPTYFGERIALRLLVTPKTKHRGVSIYDSVNLAEWQKELLARALSQSEGAVILTGPTGSGKSTLLYQCLRHILADGSKVICSLEDPVEQVVPGVHQSEVSLNRTFSLMLRSILRQDPDVIMLGEIRDQESADIAFHAATTGHLLLSTIHGATVFDAFSRLEQFNISREIVFSAVKIVLALRLAPENCSVCRVAVTLSETLATILRMPIATKAYQGLGCDACNYGKFGSQRLLIEALVVTDQVKNLLNNKAVLNSNTEIYGFRSLRQEIRDSLIEGVISPQTAARIIGVSEGYPDTRISKGLLAQGENRGIPHQDTAPNYQA